MGRTPPDKVRKLRETLHAKLKRAPAYRFYALYDKVYRPDVLLFACGRCPANGGAPGVDGQTFADIEAYAAERWVGELAEELRKRAYPPQAVQRVFIPKPEGKERPLGIPCIRDRVVQGALKLILELIFEADFQPGSYRVRLWAPTGQVEFTIAGTLRALADAMTNKVRDVVLLRTAQFLFALDNYLNSVQCFLTPESSPDQVAESVKRRLPGV